jgi:hypothetical protein
MLGHNYLSQSREISIQEFFAEARPKIKFLARCVFLMANNFEEERNIDEILVLVICYLLFAT